MTTFISKYLNTFVEYHSFDPRAKNQCVDLVNQYIVEVWGQTPIIGTDAVDFPNKIKHPLVFVPETPSTVPEPGWIVVFKKYEGLYGTPGHIAIVTEKTDLNNLWVFEQNWPTGSKCVIQRHNYRGVVGYIRNVSSTTGTMPEDTIPVKKTDFEILRTKADKLDDLVKKNITEERILGLEQVIETDRKRYDGYRETLAKNLEAENTWDSVLQQSATFSALKDKALNLEDRLDREQKQNDQERNKLLDEIDRLKADLTQMKADHEKEVEVLVKRLEVIEKKAGQQEEAQAQVDAFRKFIEIITKLFKKS